jgi:glycerol-3-phosphate acyltransferase PlsX
VALKSLEGTAGYIIGILKEKIQESVRVAAGALLLKPALKDIALDLSGDELGGAVLLGVRSPVLIGNGATSSHAVMQGTLAAAEVVRSQLVERLSAALAAEADADGATEETHES